MISWVRSKTKIPESPPKAGKFLNEKLELANNMIKQSTESSFIEKFGPSKTMDHVEKPWEVSGLTFRRKKSPTPGQGIPIRNGSFSSTPIKDEE